jgi:AcrR family transcriptional regulator
MTRDQPVTLDAGSRRRGDTLRKAIFEAVFDQLQTVGYSNLTMDKVAAAAHTSKTVLYRRWTSKDALVTETLLTAFPPLSEVTLGGDVGADVLALLRYMQSAFILTRGTAFQVVTAESGCERGFVREIVVEHVVEPCTRMIHEVLLRAAERGEVRPEAANEIVASSGPALLTYYSLVHGPRLPDDYVAAVADQVVLPLVRNDGPGAGPPGAPARSAAPGDV